MSELENIKADIAQTKVKLAIAEAKGDSVGIARLETLLTRQTEVYGILLQQSSSASAGAPIVIFHPFICTTIQFYFSILLINCGCSYHFQRRALQETRLRTCLHWYLHWYLLLLL